MIELGDKEETYEVAVIVTVPVKRLLRVKATSESHAREVAKREIMGEVKGGESHDWSVPSQSRSEVESDHDLLGPMVLIHHSNVASSNVLMTGLKPRKIA